MEAAELSGQKLQLPLSVFSRGTDTLKVQGHMSVVGLPSSCGHDVGAFLFGTEMCGFLHEVVENSY